MSIEVSPAKLTRRRDTVLAAIETFRSLDPGITVANIVLFLYVAENEGISVTELASAGGFKKPTASRSIRSLASKGSRWALPPFLGLVEVGAQGPARNSKTIRLTPHGKALCERLDQLISNPVPVRSKVVSSEAAGGNGLSIVANRAGR